MFTQLLALLLLPFLSRFVICYDFTWEVASEARIYVAPEMSIHTEWNHTIRTKSPPDHRSTRRSARARGTILFGDRALRATRGTAAKGMRYGPVKGVGDQATSTLEHRLTVPW